MTDGRRESETLDVSALYRKVITKFSDSFPKKLKTEEEAIFRELLNSKNAFSSLPTGYGMSLIYAVFH